MEPSKAPCGQGLPPIREVVEREPTRQELVELEERIGT